MKKKKKLLNVVSLDRAKQGRENNKNKRPETNVVETKGIENDSISEIVPDVQVNRVLLSEPVSKDPVPKDNKILKRKREKLRIVNKVQKAEPKTSTDKKENTPFKNRKKENSFKCPAGGNGGNGSGGKNSTKKLMDMHKASRSDIEKRKYSPRTRPNRPKVQSGLKSKPVPKTNWNELYENIMNPNHIRFVEAVMEMHCVPSAQYLLDVKSRFINYLKMTKEEKFKRVPTDHNKMFISLLYNDLFNTLFGWELLYDAEDIPKSSIREFYNLIQTILCGKFDVANDNVKFDGSVYTIDIGVNVMIHITDIESIGVEAKYNPKQYCLDISEALLEVLVANQLNDEKLAKKVVLKCTGATKGKPSHYYSKTDFNDDIRKNRSNLNPRLVNFKKQEFAQKALAHRDISEKYLVELNITKALFNTTKEINLSEKLFKFGKKNLSNSNIPKNLQLTASEAFDKDSETFNDLDYFVNFSSYGIQKDTTLTSTILHFKALTSTFINILRNEVMDDLMISNNYSWESQKELINSLRNRYGRTRSVDTTVMSEVLDNFVLGITKDDIPFSGKNFIDWDKWAKNNFGGLPICSEIINVPYADECSFDLNLLTEGYPETIFISGWGRVASTHIYNVPYFKILILVSAMYRAQGGTDLLKAVLKDNIILTVQNNILSVRIKGI